MKQKNTGALGCVLLEFSDFLPIFPKETNDAKGMTICLYM